VDPTTADTAASSSAASSSAAPLKPLTFTEHRVLLWQTLCQPTTLQLLVFVSGNNLVSFLSSIVQWDVQYNLLGLSNLQSGFMSVLSSGTAATAIWIFQRNFINRNWRYSQYANICFCAALGLGWLFVVNNIQVFEMVWMTIFLQANQSIAGAGTQVLAGLAIIELAPKKQETVTFEVILSTANSALTINSLLATQLLAALGIGTCVHARRTLCRDPAAVNMGTKQTFQDSGGPRKFSTYTLVVFGLNMLGMWLFVRFLPGSKAECHERRGGGTDDNIQMTESPLFSNTAVHDGNDALDGNDTPSQRRRPWNWLSSPRIGVASVALCSAILIYQIVFFFALLIPKASCSQAFGGSGC
jgi:hypothetical protein